MPGCSTCHDHQPAQSVSPTYKKVLWVALVVNLGIFIVEVASGLKAGSVSLLADSLDFFGDAANYAVSLFVLGMALSIRAKAALVKGATLGIFGVGVLAYTAYRLWTGQVPEPLTMGVVAVLALVANVAVALMLYKWREGDAIGNVAVVAAAGLVAWTGSAWPDLAVAVLMATLGITAARTIITQAWRELNQTSV